MSSERPDHPHFVVTWNNGTTSDFWPGHADDEDGEHVPDRRALRYLRLEPLVYGYYMYEGEPVYCQVVGQALGALPSRLLVESDPRVPHGLDIDREVPSLFD